MSIATGLYSHDSIPSEQWTYQVNGTPTLPLIGINHLLLVSTVVQSNKQKLALLTALNWQNGRFLWQKKFSDSYIIGVSATNQQQFPQSEIDIIVSTQSTDFLQARGQLVALDKHGQARWSWSPQNSLRISAPTIANDHIIITVDSERLTWVDLKSGRQKHSTSLPVKASPAAPLWNQGIIYIPCQGPNLVAMREDGRLHWQYTYSEEDTWLDQTPTFANGQLFIPTSNGSLLVLDTDDGALMWEQQLPTPNQALSTIHVENGRFFVGGRSGLYAFSESDTENKWYFPTERPITAMPILCDNVLYAVDHDHNVNAIQADTGKLIWQYHTNIERRIEVTPYMSIHSSRPHIIIADRSGLVRCLIDKPKETKNYIQIAKAYIKSGDLELAALNFENGASWLDAAVVWRQLDRPRAYAAALYKHALKIDKQQERSREEIAEVWEKARWVFSDLGKDKLAAKCVGKVAYYLNQPILNLSVEHDGLVLNVWKKLTFSIRNDGFGSAHQVVVRLISEQFQIQEEVMQTADKRGTLQPNGLLRQTISVKPLDAGQAVPLHVKLEYKIGSEKTCLQYAIYYSQVSQSSQLRQPDKVDLLLKAKVLKGKANNGIDLEKFKQNLAEFFSYSELRSLCLFLQIDHEEIDVEKGKSEFARRLITYTKRREKFSELRQYCQENRPHINW